MTDFDGPDFQYRPWTFTAQAVQLTVENAHQVAKWCADELVDWRWSDEDAELHILEPDGLVPTIAHVNDWVVKELGVFTVYDTETFREMYRRVVPEPATTWPAEAAPVSAEEVNS